VPDGSLPATTLQTAKLAQHAILNKLKIRVDSLLLSHAPTVK
jgi:hypothetical protein